MISSLHAATPPQAALLQCQLPIEITYRCRDSAKHDNDYATSHSWHDMSEGAVAVGNLSHPPYRSQDTVALIIHTQQFMCFCWEAGEGTLDISSLFKIKCH